MPAGHPPGVVHVMEHAVGSAGWQAARARTAAAEMMPVHVTVCRVDRPSRRKSQPDRRDRDCVRAWRVGWPEGRTRTAGRVRGAGRGRWESARLAVARPLHRRGMQWKWSLIRWRSEEHTSELQSRLHLVCRLLLEKKKKK